LVVEERWEEIHGPVHLVSPVNGLVKCIKRVHQLYRKDE